MIKRLLLILLIALSPTLSFAAKIGPTQPLNDDQILRGRFHQLHQLRNPDPPIRSEGRFLIAPKLGVIFSVEKPFPMTFVITPLGMVQTVGGMPFLRLTAKESSFIASIPSLLIAAISNKWKNLEDRFTMAQDGSSDYWRVNLTPKTQDRRVPFKNIMASGGKFIEQAEVQRLDGLYDFFRFYDLSIEPNKLTAEELAEFKKVIVPAKK